MPLRRGLSGRLGRLMDEEEPFLPPQKGERRDTTALSTERFLVI